MDRPLTFENLVALIRSDQRISVSKSITEHTELERDLGITGDDGAELLIEIEKQFSLSFAGKDGTIKEVFGLGENQYLFHSEAFFPFTWLLSIFGKKEAYVKPLTVGQLYEAAKKAKVK